MASIRYLHGDQRLDRRMRAHRCMNQNNISGNLLDLNTKRGRYMFNHDLSYLLILVNDSLWNPVFNDIPVKSALHVEPASLFPLGNTQLFNGFHDN